jgi:hypothetical protein
MAVQSIKAVSEDEGGLGSGSRRGRSSIPAPLSKQRERTASWDGKLQRRGRKAALVHEEMSGWTLPTQGRGSVFRIVRQERRSEQDKPVVSAAKDGGPRTRRAMKVPGPVLSCPRYYLGLSGCGQTFRVERYYGAEDGLVRCPYCGLFFPKDLP